MPNTGSKVLRAFAIAIALLAFAAGGWTQQTQQTQQTPSLAGDYAGEIGPQDATLHLKTGPDGALHGTLDHLDPSAPWMFVLTAIELRGQSLSFAIASLEGRWSGEVSSDAKTLSGTWTQKGASLHVSFVRQEFIPAAKPSPVDGIWLGQIAVKDGFPTRIQVVLRSDSSGREYCTMDLLDAHDMDLQCANVAWHGTDLSLDIPAIGHHWSGKLAPSGDSLTGTLSATLVEDGKPRPILVPLDFSRQTALSAEKPIPAATYDAALPPVTAADLQSVLDRDLAQELKSGELSPSTGGGVSIAVYAHGARRVFSYGASTPDAIFEIGSITKTFTGLLLSQMALEGKVQLDEPVRNLLPPGTVAKPQGAEITLLDLATQRSGLPPMPDNISVDNLDNPYAAYSAADLLSYLGKHGVANPTRAASPFGSLGFGLLGVALANRAGAPYSALLRDQITGPLGLADTAIALTPQQLLRFAPGRDEMHGPAKPWDADALAGAIALRSTSADMLAFLEANLHPESVKPAADSPGAATIAAALRQSLQPQAEAIGNMRIALGWLYQPETGNYWHNGATAAYSSYAFFNPQGDYAAVVLFNGSPGVNGSFVEVLGRHISQRLAGKPAISLVPQD